MQENHAPGNKTHPLRNLRDVLTHYGVAGPQDPEAEEGTDMGHMRIEQMTAPERVKLLAQTMKALGEAMVEEVDAAGQITAVPQPAVTPKDAAACLLEHFVIYDLIDRLGRTCADAIIAELSAVAGLPAVDRG